MSTVWRAVVRRCIVAQCCNCSAKSLQWQFCVCASLHFKLRLWFCVLWQSPCRLSCCLVTEQLRCCSSCFTLIGLQSGPGWGFNCTHSSIAWNARCAANLYLMLPRRLKDYATQELCRSLPTGCASTCPVEDNVVPLAGVVRYVRQCAGVFPVGSAACEATDVVGYTLGCLAGCQN